MDSLDPEGKTPFSYQALKDPEKGEEGWPRLQVGAPALRAGHLRASGKAMRLPCTPAACSSCFTVATWQGWRAAALQGPAGDATTGAAGSSGGRAPACGSACCLSPTPLKKRARKTLWRLVPGLITALCCAALRCGVCRWRIGATRAAPSGSYTWRWPCGRMGCRCGGSRGRRVHGSVRHGVSIDGARHGCAAAKETMVDQETL